MVTLEQGFGILLFGLFIGVILLTDFSWLRSELSAHITIFTILLCATLALSIQERSALWLAAGMIGGACLGYLDRKKTKPG